MADAYNEIDTLAQLSNLKIISFSGASHVFGQDYTAIMKKNIYYEFDDQLASNRLFFSGKMDIKIGDVLMYQWYLNNYAKNNTKLTIAALNIKNILHYSGSKIVFRDESFRDRFDNMLHQLIDVGRIDKLTAYWLTQFSLPQVNHQFIQTKAL